MAANRAIHFRAPTALLTTLLAGLLAAAGYDVFYRSLAGKVVPSGLYNIAGVAVSPQQINITARTAFAFLFQDCLTAAIAIAYTQLLWTISIGQPIPLGALDMVFSALGSPFHLLYFVAWWKFRLLFLLAIISWLVPIASVVTPAALTVVQQEHVHSALVFVPNVNFNSLNFLSAMPTPWGAYKHWSGVAYYKYSGPGLFVKQLVTAVAAGGSILAIAPPALKANWTLDLIGPVLRCESVTGGLLTAIQDNIRSASHGCLKRYAYIGWTPTMDDAMPLSTRDQLFHTAPSNPKQGVNAHTNGNLSVIANISAPATL